MNILIVGSGAREHAIAAALHRSNHHPRLFCCGTSLNPGIKQMTHHYWVGDITHIDTISDLACKWKIGLAIIGPEVPLAAGLADRLWANCIPTIGPKQKLAQIETSKGFARELMKKNKIRGLPRYQVFQDLKNAASFLAELGEGNYVVKADGLMGGKGVKVAGDHLHSFDEALIFCESILKQGQSFIIEEKLLGQEFSLMCFCDGEHLIPMPIVQDHKRAYVDDKGPNTGGMGSYSDADHRLPFLTDADVLQAMEMNEAILSALSNEFQERYIGILYGSFIATRDGVCVIEFNARFGDPEAMNVLTVLESDFVKICQAMVTGNLSPEHVVFSRKATVCKYAVPEGYPEQPVKDRPIDIAAVKNKSHLYLASVNAVDGKIYLTGSRAAAYVGVDHSISAAEEIAEKEVRGIAGPLYHREDIGTDQLIKRRIDEMRKWRMT
ncbi:MAG: phosphoribosylamine--glycine ligase [Gammaproteobacteria bacterium RIFCSPHIGHO2_12_FULL_38_14]|nr:MAG: phosphoribosylamine--glycine ligase [Gammaproteobacteria bacterium RIFCSPHIGHO2_12_FULL_38_14]